MIFPHLYKKSKSKLGNPLMEPFNAYSTVNTQSRAFDQMEAKNDAARYRAIVDSVQKRLKEIK